MGPQLPSAVSPANTSRPRLQATPLLAWNTEIFAFLVSADANDWSRRISPECGVLRSGSKSGGSKNVRWRRWPVFDVDSGPSAWATSWSAPVPRAVRVLPQPQSLPGNRERDTDNPRRGVLRHGVIARAE